MQNLPKCEIRVNLEEVAMLFRNKNPLMMNILREKTFGKLGVGSKTPGTETFRWGGTPPPGASTDENFPKS